MDELLDFTGKVALITGAGGGFGRLLAQGLAKRGCKLVISDINQQNLDETLAFLPDQGSAMSMLCDVSKEQKFVYFFRNHSGHQLYRHRTLTQTMGARKRLVTGTMGDVYGHLKARTACTQLNYRVSHFEKYYLFFTKLFI